MNAAGKLRRIAIVLVAWLLAVELTACTKTVTAECADGSTRVYVIYPGGMSAAKAKISADRDCGAEGLRKDTWEW